MRAYLGQIEIPARELERTAQFYRAAFGWRSDEVAWNGGRYLRLEIAAGGEPLPAAGAGLIAAGEAGIERPLAVVHVEGGVLEEWLGRVVIAGGRLEAPPIRVADSGRFALFRDPEANLLGLWHATVGRPRQAPGGA